MLKSSVEDVLKLMYNEVPFVCATSYVEFVLHVTLLPLYAKCVGFTFMPMLSLLLPICASFVTVSAERYIQCVSSLHYGLGCWKLRWGSRRTQLVRPHAAHSAPRTRVTITETADCDTILRGSKEKI
jgi:hypothetical protein